MASEALGDDSGEIGEREEASRRGFEWCPGRAIPWPELSFEQDAAGGPGGQHANRSATRTTLTWSPAASAAFNQSERTRLIAALRHRLNKNGELKLRNAGERSARRNREECLGLLAALIRSALAPRKRRIAKKVPRAAKRRRREQKAKRAKTKSLRRPPKLD